MSDRIRTLAIQTDGVVLERLEGDGDGDVVWQYREVISPPIDTSLKALLWAVSREGIQMATVDGSELLVVGKTEALKKAVPTIVSIRYAIMDALSPL